MMSIKKINNYTNLLLIYQMYEKAKILLSFHQSGQWQNHEPSLRTIQKDIELEQFFGLYQDDQLIGTCALLQEDSSYKTLLKGTWLNDEPYIVIHRFVIDETYHRLGYGSQFLSLIEKMSLEKGIFNIRVDTHVRNTPMTKLLLKHRYIECGEAYIEGAGERIVYHKEMRNTDETSIRE
jgi:RimJ/RimL family protein N-acetyltransferase